MEGINTSQDPDYVGPTGHEKRVHKNHFAAPGIKLRSLKPSRFMWVENGTGRWKLVLREEVNAKLDQ